MEKKYFCATMGCYFENLNTCASRKTNKKHECSSCHGAVKTTNEPDGKIITEKDAIAINIMDTENNKCKYDGCTSQAEISGMCRPCYMKLYRLKMRCKICNGVIYKKGLCKSCFDEKNDREKKAECRIKGKNIKIVVKRLVYCNNTEVGFLSEDGSLILLCKSCN